MWWYRLAIQEVVAIITFIPVVAAMGGAARLIQRAVGYKATVCNGGVILRDDELTGTRTGQVIR